MIVARRRLLFLVGLLAALGLRTGDAPSRAEGKPVPQGQAPAQKDKEAEDEPKSLLGADVPKSKVPMGGPPRKLEGQKRPVTWLAFSPDGKTLASANMDGTVYLWDLATSTARLKLKTAAEKADAPPPPVYSAAFSPNGKVLATAGADKLVRLWNPATGEEVRQLKGHQDEVAGVAFSPDGKLLASGSYDGTVRLWDAGTGQELRQLKGHEGRVTCVAFSPDGKTLATGGAYINHIFNSDPGQADQVRLWQVNNGQELRKLQGRGTTIAFAPDGRTIAAGGLVNDIRKEPGSTILDGFDQFSVSDVITGEQVFGAQRRGAAVAFSPDARLLASGFGDCGHIPGSIIGPNGINARRTDYTLRVWETITGQEVLLLPEKLARMIVFSPDGKFVAAGNSTGAVLVWNLSFGKQMEPPKDFGPKHLDKLWTDLAMQEAAIAYEAIWALVTAREKAVDLMKKHLRPVPEADLKRVRQLIDQLNDEEFDIREAATKELRGYGAMIEPALRQALEAKPPVEATRRLEAILADQKGSAPNDLRMLRAIQVLERIGSPEARQVLEALARGAPLARPTRDAKVTLERLEQRRADR